MMPYFKLGVYKDVAEEREPVKRPKKEMDPKKVMETLHLKAKGEGEVGKAHSKVPDKYKNPSLKIAGFGGQGVLLLGEVLAKAAMMREYEVSWLPSYGPEMRGGTANCSVIIQEEKIGSPMANNPKVLIAMNRPSLEKFENDVLPGGVIFYNSSLIDITPGRDDVEVIAVPATEIADELGNVRVSNMAMLGAYIARTGLLEKDAVVEALSVSISRKKLIPLNEEAILKGMAHVENLENKA